MIALPFWLDLLIAACGGLAQGLAFAPNEAWWLQLIAVAVLAWRVQATASAGRAAVLGWLFAFAWLAGGIWWLFISMHRYGGLPAWLAALAVVLLCALLALYLAAAMALFVRWRSGRPLSNNLSNSLSDSLLFAACWLLAELARGVLFTGFPWLASGYAHTDGPLAGFAPWVGVYGLGALAAWLAAAVAAILPAARSGRAWLQAAWLAGLLAAALLGGGAALGGLSFTRSAGTLRVALLQGNVPQDEKFTVQRLPDTLTWYGGQILRADRDGADLAIAPETAIPVLPKQLPAGYWDELQAALRQGRTAALIGLPLGSYEQGYTNSVIGLGPGLSDSRDSHGAPRPPGAPRPSGDNPAYRYDKHHLVPFGEFIPPGFRWFVALMNMPLGDFLRGPLNAPSFAVNGQRIAPNICYEDLFGEELAARFADPAAAPTVFANVSNIGWFGDTVAVDQHLQISRMRTLELERPMLRATNTGATALIDHRGKVTGWLAPYTRGVLTGRIEGRTGLTPYARWAARWGHAPLLLLGLLILGVAAVAKRQGERQGNRQAKRQGKPS